MGSTQTQAGRICGNMRFWLGKKKTFAAKMLCRVTVVAVVPLSAPSDTVSVTANGLPVADAYVCEGSGPLPVFPSPKLHVNSSGWPSGSNELDPSKATGTPAIP